MIGATPFLMAAGTADAPLMRLLAELGADPLLPNADNTTPIQFAAGVGTYSPGEDPGTEAEVLEAVKAALGLGGDVTGIGAVLPRRTFEARTPSRGFFSIHQIRT
jgi:hypothetical protein